MKIKSKLIYGSLSLVLISLLLVGLSASYIASTKSQQTISELTQSKLSAILELKKAHIEAYLSGLRKQFQLMAQDQNTGSANFHFFNTYDAIVQSSGMSEIKKQELKDYFQTEYVDKYNVVNSQHSIETAAFFSNFDENTWLLQYHYIFANPNAVGEKQKLESPINEFSSYSSAHSGYHNAFLEYADKLGFGDVYLVGPEGRINYSLNKGFELGTSLIDGPFSDSGLGRSFRAALKVQQGELVYEDYSAYAPLHDAPVSFIATPLTKFKRVRGVLVVQFPIDAIDSIMTNDNSWVDVGLGKTGEAYLVGADSTLRNTSRLNAEDIAAYIEYVEKLAETDTQPIKQITARSSGIGLHRINTDAAKNALLGNSGFERIAQADGREVLSAYSPVEVEGFNWAIISEIDVEEAFASSKLLSRELSVSLVILTIIVIVIAAILAVLLAKSLFKPIENMSGRMQEIAKGRARLDSRLDDSGNNEIADFAASFNLFVSKLAHFVERTKEASQALVKQSSQLSKLSESGSAQSVEQNAQIGSVMQSISQIASSINQTAESAKAASQVAASANQRSLEGRAATQEAIEAIYSVESEVEKAAMSLRALEQDSNDVSEVLAVIDSISDQTNLLALNAAIEAARAGDSGRGFAVVADEVRSLSHKIQSETSVINETIEKLQQGTVETVKVMRESKNKTSASASLSSKAGEALDVVVDGSRRIAEMNEDISNSATEQTQLVNQIENSIELASDVTKASTRAAVEINEIGREISNLARELDELVAQFSSH